MLRRRGIEVRPRAGPALARARLCPAVWTTRRFEGTLATPAPTPTSQPERPSAWLFFNGAYPLRLGRWDFRQYISSLEREGLVDRLKQVVSESQSHHGLQIDEVQSRAKDGGAFVKLSYSPQGETTETAESHILENVRQVASEKGYKPWWLLGPSDVFVVKGKPWLEDMDRFPNNYLKVEIDGADIPQEQLWELMRPYGRVCDLQPANPKDTPKVATVIFNSIRSASGARNCLHGYTYTSPSGATSTIRILYGPRMRAHAARDWATNHPRIVLPILAVLLGSLSYTLFDPIRAFFIRAHIHGTFDPRKYRLFTWLKTETLGRLGISRDADETGATLVEAERKDAEKQVESWLADAPETFISVTGPNGSGKGNLVDSVLAKRKNVLTIDCVAIAKNAGSDQKMVSALADAVGYFPEFGFLANASNMIDLASVGLIGQKAGFSTSVDTQLKQILDVTSAALRKIADRARLDFEKSSARKDARSKAEANHPELADKVRAGRAHDGRLGAVSGTGVVTELGTGVEKDDDPPDATVVGPKSTARAQLLSSDGRTDPTDSAADIRGLPVVVLKGFYTKDAQNKDVLWDTLADWAAALVENEIAHVVFTSENVAVTKPLTKALPGRPLNNVTLTDANPESALQFISQKLAGYGKSDALSESNGPLVEHLGGRLTDLETLVQKIRSGIPLEEAVEEIINRSVTEIKKNCVGDGEEAAKALPWKREQVWGLIKELADKDELVYDDVLINKFGGDDASLAALEGTELIAVLHREHRESVIRCGKPVYRSAVKRLIADRHFAAINDLRVANTALSGAEATIKSTSDELVALGRLFQDGGRWSFGGASRVPVEIQWRVDSLLGKMREAEETVAKASKEAARCKAILKEPSPREQKA